LSGAAAALAGRIVVIGSVNTDLVVFTERMAEAGETLAAQDFALLPGGKGANQAVAACRLGGDVALVGRVGDDAFGALARAALVGIDLGGLRTTPGVPSGVASIVVDASGENRILVVGGANLCVQEADIPDLTGAAVVVLQLEIPVETVYNAIGMALAAGVRVVLNPAPAVALDMARLRGVSYLVPNRLELGVLTGRPTGSSDEIVAASRRLLRAGIGAVIVTLGADGAMLVTMHRVAHVEAPAMRVVDTTGAGDAFIGCFAQSLVETGDEDAALARAVRYASMSVAVRGAQASYPTRAAFQPHNPDTGANPKSV